MGDAPKKKIDPGAIQLPGAVFSSPVCLFLLDRTALGAVPAGVRQLAFLSCFFCGAFNCVMLYLMAHAMQIRGSGALRRGDPPHLPLTVRKGSRGDKRR